MKNQKSNIKAWEKEVEENYPRKEYQGVFEAVLHLKGTVAYAESPKGKKLLIEEFGDMKYEMQVDLQRKSLATREAELRFLKGLFK